ncbi:MAG: hydrogenase expression/formation protein HypE [Actinomycetota bacterium]|nr:hydrogenase expression/formation protein HypE [Actinomycetota bacterium]
MRQEAGGRRQEAFITLAHGSGGRLAAEFIQRRLAPLFPGLGEMDDAAVLRPKGAGIAFTTDSFVVDPLFFPGGDIGRLAVFGTVNDLAVQGAKPSWLSLAVVAPEGLPLDIFDAVIASVAAAAKETGVSVVTGDTKVVERGGLSGLILNTAGIGEMIPGADLSAARITAGDAIIVSGPIGAHEVAVLSQRHSLGFDKIQSDCAQVACLAGELVGRLKDAVRWMRDPTRGGLATVLNEMAVAAKATIEIVEDQIPIEPAVQNAADILGLDPLYLACEGRFVAVVAGPRAEEALRRLKLRPGGENTAIIGSVTGVDNEHPQVRLNTRFGSRRILRYLAADQQPRIC